MENYMYMHTWGKIEIHLSCMGFFENTTRIWEVLIFLRFHEVPDFASSEDWFSNMIALNLLFTLVDIHKLRNYNCAYLTGNKDSLKFFFFKRLKSCDILNSTDFPIRICWRKLVFARCRFTLIWIFQPSSVRFLEAPSTRFSIPGLHTLWPQQTIPAYYLENVSRFVRTWLFFVIWFCLRSTSLK